ncbi:MAG: DNA polymerase III subunit delta' [Xanthomonadales bacterium]|nr:DNA polymerase III subunit delta' [Xanthomonadales bacterium]
MTDLLADTGGGPGGGSGGSRGGDSGAGSGTLPWLRAVEAEFAERLAADRVAHAVLLAGPAGTGKGALAAGFMAGLLCLENRYPACGECRSCRLLRSGAHPDGHVVTFEPHPNKKDELRTEIVVDQVRRLTAALQLTNTVSRRKAALVVPAEVLNVAAANALLKTLEEPPGDAVLLLVAHQPSRLAATIRSRCQALNVRLPDRDEALGWLAGEVGGQAEQAALALEAAAGSPLVARQMLQNNGTEAYAALAATLESLRGADGAPGAAMADLAEVDPGLLWTWLSLRAAQETRTHLGRPDLARRFAGLQAEADRNRRLVPTPVRKDLLLQDWLIQWAQIGPEG